MDGRALTPHDVVMELAQNGIMLEPAAAKLLAQSCTPEELDAFAKERNSAGADGELVLTTSDVKEILEKFRKTSPEGEHVKHIEPHTTSINTWVNPGANLLLSTRPKVSYDESRGGSFSEGGDVDNEEELCQLDIVQNIQTLGSLGGYEGFLTHFQQRYEKLLSLLKRKGPRGPSTLRKLQPQEDVWTAGIVYDKRVTKNGHVIVELEDKQGAFPIFFSKDSELMGTVVDHIITDEVIAVRGCLTFNKGLFVAHEVVFPDIPENGKQEELEKRGRGEGYIVFTSDIHVGSTHFLENKWGAFVNWLQGDGSSKPSVKELAKKVRCVVISGDLVDGVGVYPNQEKELELMDVFEQYRYLAELIEDIPHNIRIVIGPGNHDIVRQAEPQPALPHSVQKMFNRPITWVSNPALVEIEGVRVMMYHGRSLNDLIPTLKLSYEHPAEAMLHMMKKRHLAPIYGGAVPIAPEPDDHLIIDKIPDVLHCGHVHIADYKTYRGVRLINSGTWQSQTDFQKMKNLNPTPAKVPIMDIKKMKVAFLKF